MKLKALLQDVETKDVCTVNPEITNISDDSDKIRSSGVFVCITGGRADGNDYIHKALDRGASVIVGERNSNSDNYITVKDSRKAYAVMCSNFYGSCHRSLRIVGITGTNGKTSTSYILKKILEDAGHKVGLIGTVGVLIGQERYPADLTTPNPVDLHRYFMMMKAARCDICIMEISSQSLVQDRVYGINFDCGVFTNLTPEHLDYHKDMESYAKAKSLLFSSSKVSVINADDDYADYMKKASLGRVISFSVDAEADFRARDIKLSDRGVGYTLSAGGADYPAVYGGMGKFSVCNSMAAVAAAQVLGVDIEKALLSVARSEQIAGRMEKVENNFGINIIIDYAHTPDSLENALKTLKSVYGGRLITVFGCGGDRDKTKRPLMGEIACKLSDIVFVTSDNPRTEAPEAIINDISSGIKSSSVFKITDRTSAIKAAVFSAKKGDTVLIAGKGHEKYQIIGTQKIYYNEREIIGKLLNEKENF